jgi:hypothetical protein
LVRRESGADAERSAGERTGVYESRTIRELALRYQLENAALDARLEAERAQREQRPL